jgi:hypothetical protein
MTIANLFLTLLAIYLVGGIGCASFMALCFHKINQRYPHAARLLLSDPILVKHGITQTKAVLMVGALWPGFLYYVRRMKAQRSK